MVLGVSMRRCLSIGVVLVLGLAQSPAGGMPAGRERVERVDYAPQDGVKGIHTGLGPIVASVVIPGGTENRASLRIEDATGQPVLAQVIQDQTVATFCGETGGPIPVMPGFDLEVQLYEGRCMDGTPAAATTGTVEATFTTASKKEAIVQRHEYSAQQPFYLGKGDEGAIVTGVLFPARASGILEVLVEDDSGTTVPFYVEQGSEDLGPGCGSGRFRVRAGDEVKILLFDGVCTETGEPGVTTHGFVTTTLRRK